MMGIYDTDNHSRTGRHCTDEAQSSEAVGHGTRGYSGGPVPQTALQGHRSVDKGSLKFTTRIFTHNELWFARASTFNDPFDCNHTIDIDRDSEEWRELLSRFEQQTAEESSARPPG